MLVGYMRVSSDGDRQVLDLQRDALLAAGVDERHLFEDHASGSQGDRLGLARALTLLWPDDCCYPADRRPVRKLRITDATARAKPVNTAVRPQTGDR